MWPWVSRRAFDLALSERDRLRDEQRQLLDRICALTEQVTRIQRFSQGMSEAPRQEREPLGRMPATLVEYIAGAQSSQIRREMERTFWRRRARGDSADAIVADLIPTTENGASDEAEP